MALFKVFLISFFFSFFFEKKWCFYLRFLWSFCSSFGCVFSFFLSLCVCLELCVCVEVAEKEDMSNKKSKREKKEEQHEE